jgi:hypothetical protein
VSSPNIWQELEGADRARRLAGLEHRLKARDRVEAKISEEMRVKGRTADEARAAITDKTRYTFVYPSDTYRAGVRADIERLWASGCVEVELRDFREAPVRLGVVSVWREPESGDLVEVQFHTRLSYSVRERSFPLYARLREPEAGDAERADLLALQRAIYWCGPAPVPSPGPGATAERVISYAIIDDRSSIDEPAGVLRRIVHGNGQRDEAFGRDLAWRHTSLLYSAERGCLDNKLRQISGGEADDIVQRIRGRRPPAGWEQGAPVPRAGRDRGAAEPGPASGTFPSAPRDRAVVSR